MLNANDFPAPGPGAWELESVHMIRPVSRSMASILPAAATAGFRDSMARYGMLLDYMEFAVVNRFVYICARPVGAPKGAKGPPPRMIFKLLTKLHPEMRKRIKTVAEVWRTKLWREDVQRWDSERKPAIFKENTSLQNVDVRALSDEELAVHLGRCFDAVRRGVTTHHSLNATAMLPLGDFLVHVREWTGLAPAEVLPILRGSSRVSQGATGELDALAAAVVESGADVIPGEVEDAGGREASESRHPQRPGPSTRARDDKAVAIIDRLIARTDAVGTAARCYLDVASVRIATGYDFADVSLGE